jgi:hypothetical protein
MPSNGVAFPRLRSALRTPPTTATLVKVLLLCPLALWGCGGGAPDFTPEELAEATARAREAYYTQDYYFGIELGEEWASRAPEALELKAWAVASLASTGLGLQGGLPRTMAEEMVADHPESPWSWFALAELIASDYPYRDREEVMAACDKAIAGLPGNPDPLILRAEMLLRYQDRESALAFLDALPEPMRSHPDISIVRVSHLLPPARERSDADVRSIIESYEGILAEDPDHVLANYGFGMFLMGIEGGGERGRTYLEHAASLSSSPMPHSRLWQQIVKDPDLDAEGRSSQVAADVHYVLENFPESPGRWATMASNLAWLGLPDLQAELEEKVLREYPDGWAAERILGARFSELAYEHDSERPANREASLEESQRLEAMLQDFVARREHRDASLLRNAWWELFLLEKDKPDADLVRAAELAETWAGYVDQVHEIWADQKCFLAAISLARQPRTLDVARRLLEAGKVEMDKFARERELQTESFNAAVLPAQERHVRSSMAYLSIASALVLAQEGAFTEAQAALDEARDFDPEDENAQSVLPLVDLAAGRLEELRAELAAENGDGETARKLLASAEQSFMHGLRGDYYARPDYGLGWTNPNETALRDLYRMKQGSLEGFEAYLASAKEEGSAARQDEVLASRIADPRPILPFALKNLDGEEVRYESYLGKVVVVNFWGTW